MTPARRMSAPTVRRSLGLALGVLAVTSPVIANAEAPEAPAAPVNAPPSLVVPAQAEGEQPPAAAPMNAEARAHYEQGLRLYGDRDFPGAIRELEAGFALDPRREFLFAEAQAYRLAGDCARAVPLYERFLGSGPSPLQVDATRLALDRCARQPPPVATAPAQPVPPPAPRLPPPMVAPPPWWHDRWALGATAAGVVATGVGVGFLLASKGAAARADDPATTHYADYDRLWDTAQHRQTVGIASLAAGGALLAAGALRFMWVRRAAGTEGTAALSLGTVVAPAAGGATLLQQVSF